MRVIQLSDSIWNVSFQITSLLIYQQKCGIRLSNVLYQYCVAFVCNQKINFSQIKLENSQWLGCNFNFVSKIGESNVKMCKHKWNICFGTEASCSQCIILCIDSLCALLRVYVVHKYTDTAAWLCTWTVGFCAYKIGKPFVAEYSSIMHGPHGAMEARRTSNPLG